MLDEIFDGLDPVVRRLVKKILIDNVSANDMTVVIASDNIASHEYYADFQHEEYGLTRLIFAPDERILDNIKKSLPPQLKRELNI